MMNYKVVLPENSASDQATSTAANLSHLYSATSHSATAAPTTDAQSSKTDNSNAPSVANDADNSDPPCLERVPK